VATDDEIYVPYLNKSTAMAARQIDLEAHERGWSHIDISGTTEFCVAAEEAIRELGMGAIITPKEKYFANKSIRIMPRPPAMMHPKSEQVQAQTSHDELMSDKGKAPEKGAKPAGSEKKDGPDEAVQVPFDDEEGKPASTADETAPTPA
jgi:hypothetical protein